VINNNQIVANHYRFVFSKKCYSLDLWIVADIAMIHMIIAHAAILLQMQWCFWLLRKVKWSG